MENILIKQNRIKSINTNYDRICTKQKQKKFPGTFLKS